MIYIYTPEENIYIQKHVGVHGKINLLFLNLRMDFKAPNTCGRGRKRRNSITIIIIEMGGGG
jgi:hypothetical protein